jgi:protein-tyrosine kinase
MGRVADALAKSFPTRDKEVLSTPSGNPWQLAEGPDDDTVTIAPPRPKSAVAPIRLKEAVPPSLPEERRVRIEVPTNGAPSDQRSLLRNVDRPAGSASSAADPRYNGKLIVNDELSVSVKEQFRSLATTIYHSGQQAGMRVLLVCSALPGEGKTLISSNLAQTLSTSLDLRVLLVDIDLRRPSLHSVFGLEAAPGLAESLEGNFASPVPAVQVSPRLSVVVAGRPPHDSMKVVAGSAMQRLLRQARSEYDWVILDSPPLGLVADAALLAALADKVLLVVKADETPYPAVLDTLKSLGPDRVLGIVLNQAEESTSDRYGYGYGAQGYYGASPGGLVR